MGELRTWVDLLRNKASALRAISDAMHQQALSPVAVDPDELADVLSRVPVPRGRSRQRPPAAHDSVELLRRARVLWDVAVDAEDRLAAHDIADACDRLADQVEVAWRDARDRWRATGDQLAEIIAASQD